MNSRALPAALHLTALSAQPLSTGNLLADCERWCRDHLPPRRRLLVASVPALRGPSSLAARRGAA